MNIRNFEISKYRSFYISSFQLLAPTRRNNSSKATRHRTSLSLVTSIFFLPFICHLKPTRKLDRFTSVMRANYLTCLFQRTNKWIEKRKTPRNPHIFYYVSLDLVTYAANVYESIIRCRITLRTIFSLQIFGTHLSTERDSTISRKSRIHWPTVTR